MSNLDELKTKILEIVKDNHYSWDDIKLILSPISIYVDNPSFKQNIDQVVHILTKDRDGNNVFSIDDIKLLSKDMNAITSLVTALFLIMAGIPQMKLEYSPDETEELVFKLLAYLFLVVIPKETRMELSYEDKESVIDLSLLIYNFVKSSQVVQQLVAKVQAWFQRKGWCKCLFGEVPKSEVVDEHLPEVHQDLTNAVNNLREKGALMREIRELKAQLDSGKEEVH